MNITKISGTKAGFETVVKKTRCLSPNDLFSLEIIGIQKNERGEELQRSTYQFFMNEQQLKELSETLVQ